MSPTLLDKLFARARVWVQPGGKSTVAAQAMKPELMHRIRQFVADGGGYVGFCAGMFLATDQIGTSGVSGLGLIPGSTELYLKDDPPGFLLPVQIQKRRFKMYYAGGPKLNVSETEIRVNQVEVFASYADKSIAGVKVPFGNGRVAVVGFHPEAGWLWKLFKGIIDPFGDRWLAEKMIKWAAAH